jgi:cell division protein FtsI/penicillin-binding protein 2
MQTGLNYSLNTSVVTVAERLGDGKSITLDARKKMYDYFHDHFAFGKRTGIEVAGERAGTIYSPDNQDGNAVRYSNMAFGQGMDLTMIQVASAFGSLVNGGTYYAPTVVGGVVDASGNLSPAAAKPSRKGVITALTSDKIHQMIHAMNSMPLRTSRGMTSGEKQVRRRQSRTAVTSTIRPSVRIWVMGVTANRDMS